MTTPRNHEVPAGTLPVQEPHVFGRRGPGTLSVAIPLDLDRAWALAATQPTDRFIIQHVRAETWAQPGRCRGVVEGCCLNGSAIARRLSRSHQYVNLRIRSLVDDGMLILDGDRYRLGTDVRAWAATRLHPRFLHLIIEGYDGRDAGEPDRGADD